MSLWEWVIVSSPVRIERFHSKTELTSFIATAACEGVGYVGRKGRNVILIDTPGFDDEKLPEIEVLDSIGKYLQSNTQLRILAVIYMHRITDKRVTRTSRLSLDMFQAFCGQHFYQNVILVTTMWGVVPENIVPQLVQREAELNDSNVFWGDMKRKGAQYARHLGNTESGRDIVDLCLRKETPPR